MTDMPGCAATHRDLAAGPASTTAGWLTLSAAPTFAAMAVLTWWRGGSGTGCMADASPVDGMTLMYALMGASHAAPWLKLVARRRR